MVLTISIIYVLIFFLTWKLSFNHFLNNADVKLFTGQSRTFSFDFRGPWDSVQNICFGTCSNHDEVATFLGTHSNHDLYT